MAPQGIKASKIIERKSKAKVMEWAPRKRSRGTKYVPVEVETSKNRQRPARDTLNMEVDDHQAESQEASLPSMDMDVDETFSIEELDVPEQRRVR
jgi:hypothetical protein